VSIAPFQRRNTAARLARILRPELAGRNRRLSLLAELFLIAHDDDTGHPHIAETTLARGLAVAVLFDLCLVGRIYIGWRFNARTGRYDSEPGNIMVASTEPTGDTFADAALTELWYTGGPLRVDEFIHRFAASGLYERVRADMIAAGILTRVTRRRNWFFHREFYRATHTAHPVRARFRLRQLASVTTPEPDLKTVALAGLVTALKLTARLYPPEANTTRLHRHLAGIVAHHPDPTIRDTVSGLARRRTTLARAA